MTHSLQPGRPHPALLRYLAEHGYYGEGDVEAVVARRTVAVLAKGWKKRGYALGFGVGIALGYATIGTIGFEGRLDYGGARSQRAESPQHRLTKLEIGSRQ